mgnify:CR=1 FL=1
MRLLFASSQVFLAALISMPGCGKRDGAPSRNEKLVVWGPPLGQPAPDIAGEDMEGKGFRLSDYRGKVVLLSFWAHF